MHHNHQSRLVTVTAIEMSGPIREAQAGDLVGLVIKGKLPDNPFLMRKLMPCNCDHLEANQYEREASKLLCLLEELETGTPVDPDSSSWDGYHHKAYCKGIRKAELDRLTSDLCERLQSLDVSKYSLEMQIWWRDHQAADKARELEGGRDE